MKMILASFLMMFALTVGFALPAAAQTCENPTNTTLSGHVRFRAYSPFRPGYKLKPLAAFYIDIFGSGGYNNVTWSDQYGYYEVTDLQPCTDYYLLPQSSQPYTGPYTAVYPGIYYVNTGGGNTTNLDFEVEF